MSQAPAPADFAEIAVSQCGEHGGRRESSRRTSRPNARRGLAGHQPAGHEHRGSADKETAGHLIGGTGDRWTRALRQSRPATTGRTSAQEREPGDNTANTRNWGLVSSGTSRSLSFTGRASSLSSDENVVGVGPRLGLADVSRRFLEPYYVDQSETEQASGGRGEYSREERPAESQAP